jgi:hypothetical protein
MPGAIIAFDQARPSTPSYGSPGIARDDLWLSWEVTCRCTTSGNISYAWEFLSIPAGSAAVLADANESSATFTPDLAGTYRVQLATSGGGPGNVQVLVAAVRYNNTGTLVNRGWRIPGVGELPAEDNMEGNVRGWSAALEFILADILANLGGSSFTPGGDLSGTSTSQEVVGILGEPLPGTLGLGCLTYTGSFWTYQEVSAGGDLGGTTFSWEVTGLLRHALPTLTEGYLTYNGTAWVFSSGPSGFIANGDLFGSSTDQEVIGILGQPLPGLSAGALQWTGSDWEFGATSSAQENNPVDLNPHEVANIDPLLATGVGIQPPSLVYLTESFTESAFTAPALSGTFSVTNSSTTVTTTVDQTSVLKAGSSIAFQTQAFVWYQVQSVTSTTITLASQYTGYTSAATQGAYAPWTMVSEGVPNTATVVSSEFTFTQTGDGSTQYNNLMLEGAPIGMPQVCATIHIAAASNTGGSTYEDYSVGIAKDSNNYCYATWRQNSGYVRIHIKIAGTSTDGIAQVSVSWTPPFDLGFSLVGDNATIWYCPSGGTWTAISTAGLSSHYDFRTYGSVVANTWYGSWAAAYFPNNGAALTVSFSNFKVGSFGASGLRDTCVVSAASGSPVLSGNQVWLTATATDPGASAYCGVFTYDLVARTLTQVGAIMVDRITAAGTAPSTSASLSGTFTTAASTSVTTSTSQVGILFQNSVVQFAAQPGVYYVVQSVSSGSITLTTAYTGTTGATTATLGVIQNDNAAHIIEDGSGGFYFFISSWANTEVGSGGPYINILYKHETALNLLSGAHVVNSVTTPSLPGTSGSIGSYDPYCFFDGSTWWLAYVLAPSTSSAFYPALASSSSPGGTWAAVASDTTAVTYEGSRAVYLDGQYWLLWASAATSQARVYDLTMTYQGVYSNLAVANGYAPHPMLVPLGNYVYQVTFDNTEYESVAGALGHLRSFRSWRYSPLA